MPTALADLVAASIEALDGRLEAAIFGTADPEVVAATIERFLAAELAPPRSALLYRAGVGVVAGLRLVDGTDAVVKIHRFHASRERLTAIQTIQAHLADVGLPAPRPLVDPTPLGEGVATVEQHLPGERPPDSRAPDLRRCLAQGLHRFVEAARPCAGLPVGRPFGMAAPGRLWWEPHSLRFDFDATAAGAEWIDDAARRARARLDLDDGEPLVGHYDWRVENLVFAGTAITAIYDWDSLLVAPEPVLVGATVSQFCTDWAEDRPDPLPTIDDMHEFVADYEVARGRPFTSRERAQLDAANLLHSAYGARCQHSDLALHPDLGRPEAAWVRLLRERGDHCFDA